MDPRITQILDQERAVAERYDWSTAKVMLAAIDTARRAIERALEASERPPTGPQLAQAVGAAISELRELWVDDAGYGGSTLGSIERALHSLDEA